MIVRSHSSAKLGIRRATYSHCEQYRYSLEITWQKPWDPIIVFCGLNPSTATEIVDDRTVAKCIRLAKRCGYGGMVMLNLFAYRATNPAEMKKQENPVGLDNDFTYSGFCSFPFVACWGTHGKHLGRDQIVKGMPFDWRYLRLTKSGFPGHPLYIPEKYLVPICW